MEDQKQKTVVAFIAGLLIGGLLVWVFSIAPDKKNDMGLEKGGDQKSEEQAEVEGGTKEEGATAADTQANIGDKGGSSAPESIVVAAGAGSVVVEDQAAGAKVTLGAVTMPIKNGWIVVHEMRDGGLGNILGASRYGEAEGLKPTTVELLRATEAGKTYTVVIYSENGDRVFDKKEDAPVTTAGTGARIEDQFVAK